MQREADANFARLRDRLRHGRGELDASVRQAAFDGQPVPAELAPLVEKIATGAYRVTAADIERAKAAGYTEEALFELIASTAVGAALGRLAVVDGLLAARAGNVRGEARE